MNKKIITLNLKITLMKTMQSSKPYSKTQSGYTSFSHSNMSYKTTMNNSSSPMKQMSQYRTIPSTRNPIEPIIDKADYFYQGQINSNSLRLSQSLEMNSTNQKENPTPKILGSILDDNQKFSPNSPSNLKLCQKEIDLIQSTMNNDLSSLKFTGDNPNTYLVIAIEAGFELLLSNSNFNELSFQDKVYLILEHIENENRKCRLGCIVILYLLLKKFWDETESNLKQIIIEKIINILQSNYETQEELYLVSCLNICSLFGPTWTILLENIGLISMFITDFNYPFLQRATFTCLMSLEYEGIKTLIEIASKDYQEFQQYILSNLIKTPHIQKIIIVRALINELNSQNNGRILEALSALNRMYDIINEEKMINLIGKLFYNNRFKNHKLFIASILRTCGGEFGENILLNELDRSCDQSMKEIICKILGFRLPKKPTYLDIRLDKNDTDSIVKNPPGLFCKYFGQVTPVLGQNEQFFNEIENTDDSDDLNIDGKEDKTKPLIEEYLEVNTRDFLASLKRMITLNYDHSSPQIVYKGDKTNLLDTIDFSFSTNEDIFPLLDFINPYPTQNNNSKSSSFYITANSSKQQISNNIISSLCNHLKDNNQKVRIASAIALGQIGLPESLPAIDVLTSSLKETDVNLKSVLIWAIGRCAEGASNRIIPIIISCLDNNMWKIKRATLYAISRFGEKASDKALPILCKLLRESPINKQLIGEAIVRLGTKGESELLNIINKENDDNYKLQGAIARAFAFLNINSKNLDFIIECLFRLSSSRFEYVRKNALFTIHHLSMKTQQNNLPCIHSQGVIYLSNKNVVPFYYERLKDKDIDIQNYARYCIKSLGPQGELIFIEGLMKDPNYLIRMNCGVGLAEIGVQNLRTLINHGIFDSNENVKKGIEKSIVKNMKIDEIVNYYENANQLLSLKLLLGEILEKNIELTDVFKSFCNKLLCIIDNKVYASTQLRQCQEYNSQEIEF